MAHQDVKVWLKRNTFRDYRLNNAKLVAGSYHYQQLIEVPDFQIEAAEPVCAMEVTEAMAAKIRLLPTVGCRQFAVFREKAIDWNEKRPIDVSFAGLVDYEVRATDYWDGKLGEARAASKGGIAFLPERHRRAAVLELAKLHNLRVLIGLNRVLQPDLYQTTLLRSSIS